MVRQRARESSVEKEKPQVKISNESVDDTSCTMRIICKSAIIILIALYALLPAVLYLIPQIIEQVVYMNLVYARNEPTSLLKPASEYGLHGTATFYLPCDQEKLGVWHVLPKDKISRYEDNDVTNPNEVQRLLQDSKSTIIYHHGNSMSRATGENLQRTQLYKLLQNEGHHIITFDYRGFGDSTGWPSESGLVNDSLCVLKWVREGVSPDAKVSIWGHSLGSSIATISAAIALDECDNDQTPCLRVDNLILEGAFTNIRETAIDSFFARLFNTVYPKMLYQEILENSLSAYQITLATDESLMKISCPVMILHAEDDDIIPCKYGEALYAICEKTKHLKKRVKFVKFKALYGYTHVNICKAPEMPQMLRDFLENTDESASQVILI